MAFVANKGQNKGKRFVYSIPLLSPMLGEVKPSYVYAIMCDVREIIKSIVPPARLVPSSCAPAPRNTHEAGIPSQSYRRSTLGLVHCMNVRFVNFPSDGGLLSQF